MSSELDRFAFSLLLLLGMIDADKWASVLSDSAVRPASQVCMQLLNTPRCYFIVLYLYFVLLNIQMLLAWLNEQSNSHISPAVVFCSLANYTCLTKKRKTPSRRRVFRICFYVTETSTDTTLLYATVQYRDSTALSSVWRHLFTHV